MISEDRIERVLMHVGMTQNYTGYHYTVHGISLSYRDKCYLQNVTTFLYPAIAEKFGVKPKSVEHAIRTAIKRTWESGNQQMLRTLFGAQASCPGNAHFLSVLSSFIRLNRQVADKGEA